jgi:predicted secreted Zn-dependent protease
MISIAAPRNLFPLTLKHPATPTARATVWLPALAIVAFAGIYLPLASLFVAASSAPEAVAASPQTASSPAPHRAPATTPALTTPSCSPSSASQPPALILDSRPTGLSVAVEPLATYQIYGNSAGELRSQIQRCAPGASQSTPAEFTGETSYNLSWQYSTLISGSACQLTDVKVGISIVTSLPNWQATTSAAAGLNDRWQAFMTGLITHEQGHTALDKIYAAKLATDLTGRGQVPCNQLKSTVQAIVQADVDALNQANVQYDDQTDHGAAQGANLPIY